MKKLKSILLILSILLLMLQACDQITCNADVEADKEAIRNLLKEYCEAATSDDLERFLSAWDDDATRLEDGYYQIRGKEKLREHFKVPFELFDVEVNLYGEVQIEVYGEIAYGIGNYVLALTNEETDSTLFFDGKFLDVYKKQADGSWLFYIDCVTSNPEVTKETMKPEPSEQEDLMDPKF